MRRTPLFLAMLMAATWANSALALPPFVLKWSQVLTPGANPYYLGNNADGLSVLVGQIGYGGRQIDMEGNEVGTLGTTSLFTSGGGAKAVLRLGDYYYITQDDGGGIARFDAAGENAWDAASWVSEINPIDPATGSGIGPESIVTDGTYIYTNDDVNRNRIHAFLPSDDPYGLTHAWSADLPGGGRVRGLSYDRHGYLYMHNGGDGSSTDIYAVDIDTHQAYNVGTHDEGGTAYQVLRIDDELLVLGSSDNVSVYTMTSDTEVVAGAPAIFSPGLGDLYGATLINQTVFAASVGGRLSAFGPIDGDLSLDGFVGGDDLDIVRANWGSHVTPGSMWQGDPSGDGFVGGDDLDIVRANWGQGTPPSPTAVPEPGMASLLLLGMCSLLMGKRRHVQ